MLGSLILYVRAIRIVLFQPSGFYYSSQEVRVGFKTQRPSRAKPVNKNRAYAGTKSFKSMLSRVNTRFA